jgi:N-methylhydantoinase A
LSRADLATGRPGPCIIEEYDATCVVPPGAEAVLDRWDNIVMTLAPPVRAAKRRSKTPAVA